MVQLEVSLFNNLKVVQLQMQWVLRPGQAD